MTERVFLITVREVTPEPLTVAQAERRAIESMLAHTKGDKSKAARLLGIGRKTLYRKLEQYTAGSK